MAVKLMEHQIDAIRRMRNGCILNGGVGSGKSLTSLGYYYTRQGGPLEALTGDHVLLKNPKDLYIITTARKRDELEWEGELTQYMMSTNPEVNAYQNKVVVDSWNNIKKYKNVYGAFFIFDEQRVVGSGAWVKTFLNITRKNEWVLLSATPGDTWSDYIPVFVANGFYRNRTEFLDRHAVFSRFTKYPKIEKYVDTGRLLKLRQMILINMDRPRNTIPHHEDVFVDYDVSKYRDAGKNRWDPFRNEPIKDAGGLCYVWRRIVNEDISRQVALMEIFEDHPKLIIFYNFNYELDILREIFSGLGVQIGEWNGRRHDPVPTGAFWVYFVQYNAGAEGWNCISTDTIVFFSQNYSYKIMAQAAGRIDRLNTPFRDLYYYHLRSRSGIDLGIHRAISEKRDFNEKGYVKW